MDVPINGDKYDSQTTTNAKEDTDSFVRLINYLSL